MNSWEQILVPLLLTLKVAVCATILATLAGTAVAFAMERLRFPGRPVLDAALVLPMVLPPTVLGYYLLVLLGRRGPIGGWLQSAFGINLIFTWQAAVVAAAVVAFPLVYKTALTAFEGVEHEYQQAARVLGRSEPAVFLHVTLPLAWRGILAGSMLGFARSLGEFGATLMVAGNLPGRTQTLALAIYDAVEAGRDQLAGYLVALTSLVCLCVLLAGGWLLKPRPVR